jgi:PAS domain S-box-containing protein
MILALQIFLIEDNGPLDKNIARFTYCNRAAQQILCVSEEDVMGKSVTLMMPELIRINHELFVKRFFSDGLNRLIGKTRNIYIKDFNGYIKPVQFFLNFYYTSKLFIQHNHAY